MADRLAKLEGVPPAAPWDPRRVSERAETLFLNLVEPARVTTLAKLDEGRQALAIATGWLRSSASRRVPSEPVETPNQATL